jgi:hypothetical protein
MQLAILLFVEVAILAYMITYTVRAYTKKDTSTYRGLLFLILVLIAFKDIITCGMAKCQIGLGISFMLVLIMWAVASACNKDLEGILLLTSIFVGIEVVLHIFLLLANLKRTSN